MLIAEIFAGAAVSGLHFVKDKQQLLVGTQGIHEPVIIVMTKALHVRTMGTLTATGNTKVQEGFGPLLNGFIRVPYLNIEAIRAVTAANPNVVAVMLEPVQGEGGLATAPADYLQAVRDLCTDKELLLILDEVQTGNGRTGKYFCYQHFGFMPDVVTTAKGLGNGVPIGACLARGAAAEVLKPGNHGSTYGGNPLASAAALAVVETIEQEDLCGNAQRMGDYLRQGFRERLQGNPLLQEIRGHGLMIGLVLSQHCPALMAAALEHGLLLNVTSGNVMRLLPPLNLSQSEADHILDKVSCLILALKWAPDAVRT